MRTLYAFNVLSLLGGTVYGLYYGIFLYEKTFSLSVLALDGLFGGFGTWAGYLLGIFVIRRFGYGACLKLAFGLWAIVAFVTAIIAGHIAQWFILMAVFKALPAGLYGVAGDTITLRDVKNESRNNFLQVILAFEFLIGVLLPAMVGVLIRAKGYELSFVLAGFIYLLAFLVPVRLAKPELYFNVLETLRTFRRPWYPQHATNRTLSSGFNQLNGFMLTIIPFILLKDELKVGVLTSAIALMAGMVSLIVRRMKSQQKLRFGYGAYFIRAMVSLLFVCIWSAPILMVWQLINKLATPLHDPLQKGLDIHNDSLILGKDTQQKALQINVLNNTLLLIGMTLAYGSFFFITRSTTAQQRFVLQLLIMAYAIWRFVNLTISARINQKAQEPVGYGPLLFNFMPALVLLKRYANNQMARLVFLIAR